MLFKKPLVVPAHTVDGSHTSRNNIPIMNCSRHFEVMLVESLKDIRNPFFGSFFLLNYSALRTVPTIYCVPCSGPNKKSILHFVHLYIFFCFFYQLPPIMVTDVPSLRTKAAQQRTHYMTVKSQETIINPDRLVAFSNKHMRG